MLINGNVLRVFARIAENKAPLGKVRLSGNAIEGFAWGYCVRLTVQGSGAFEPTCIPVDYLRRIAKVGGKKQNIELRRNGKELRTLVGGSTYRKDLEADDLAPTFPTSTPDARLWEVSPADLSIGGAIFLGAHSASTDDGRPGMNAVHLDAMVSGTNGSRLSQRRPIHDLEGLDALVPLSSVAALLKLVHACPPEAIVCSRYELHGERIRFWAQCKDGVGWELDSALVDAQRPDYSRVVSAERDGEKRIALDCADFREIWWPLRKSDFRLAVFPDGSLLTWSLEGGIGSTCAEFPTTKPSIIFASSVVEALAKTIPKAGKISMAVLDSQSPARILEEWIAGVKDGVPEHVMTELASSFGISEPVQVQVAA